jgi:hypothetical protein
MDDKKNIYLTCTDGIRKFSTDGEMLWHYFPPPAEKRGSVLSMSSIMDGRLFASTQKVGCLLSTWKPERNCGLRRSQKIEALAWPP